MTDKSSCPIYKLKYSLGHLFVMLTVQGLNPVSNIYPDSIIIVFATTCVSLPLIYPVPSHSCDPLEDLLPYVS